MQIYHNEVKDSSELYETYNKLISDVPNCYSVTEDEFMDGITNRTNPSNPDAEVSHEKIIIAEEDGIVRSFAHVSVGMVKVFGTEKQGGLIHFLIYEPGYRSIGQAVLDECEDYLTQFNVNKIWAFQNASNYRFYHLWFGYLSDRLAHVHALFRINGYESDIGEMFLELPNFNICEPQIPDDDCSVIVETEDGRGELPNLRLTAKGNDGDFIGECISVSVGEFCRAKGAQRSFLTKWLGIEQKYQGKGWGRYLLQRTLSEMHRIGYETALISTNVKNYRAQLFYSNYGYRIIDTTYGLVKTLS